MSEGSSSSVNNEIISSSDEGYFSKIFNIFKNNKNYIIIGICIILICYIVYYLFFKINNKSNKITKPVLLLPPKQKITKYNNGDDEMDNDDDYDNDMLQQNEVHFSQDNKNVVRKLQHPTHPQIIKITPNTTYNENNSSEIDYELGKFNNDENINIKSQNLTNSEIEDINNKLNTI